MPAPALSSTAARSPPADGDVVDGVFYPCSDGRPMSDNEWQFQAIVNAVGDLEMALPQAYVVGNMLLYPEKGNPGRRLAPDVMVAFGVGRHKRSSYKAWEEGKPPDWVLEVASPSTVANDLAAKRRAYAEMGVPEYWLFDPRGDVFGGGRPRLMGLRLEDGAYRRIEPRLEGGLALLRSDVLGLDVRVEGELLRFRDPKTGRDIPHRHEVEEAAKREAARADREAKRAQREAKRADQEAAARRAAEQRSAELEAAIARLRERHARRRTRPPPRR